MKVIEAIGKGFGIASKSLGLLLVLFVFNAIWNLVSLPFLGNIQSPAAVKASPPLVGLGIIFIFLNMFIQGSVLGTLKDVIASGQKAGLANFTKYGGKFYLRFLSLALIIILAVVLAVLLIGLIFSISLVSKNIIVNIISVSISAILTIIALWYLFLLFMSPYVLVMDDIGVFKTMANSMQFVKKNLLRLSGLSMLLILISLGIVFVVGVVDGVLAVFISESAFKIVTAVISSGVNAYITVLISAPLMIYYSALSVAGQEIKTEEISA